MQLLLCSVVMKNIQIPCGGPIMSVVTCFERSLIWIQFVKPLYNPSKNQKFIQIFPKSRQYQCKIIWGERVTFFSKLARWRPTTVLKMNTFKDILQEFFLDFRECFIPFLNFQNTCFAESLSITAYDSSPRLLCNGLCNVILHVCRKCWRTLWIESLNALINDVPPKRIAHQ